MLLKILKAPDERLRTVAASITVFDEALKEQARDMLETLKSTKNACGLSGTQVDYHYRLIVICLPHDVPIVLCNPTVVQAYGRIKVDGEGCLSVPSTLGPAGVLKKVARPTRLRLTYQSILGAHLALNCQHLLARAIQHEMDHLEGILIGDDPKLRERALRGLEAQEGVQPL